MFRSKTFRRLLGAREAAEARVPDDVVVYAIGDIHGRADLLAPLLTRIEAEGAHLEGRRLQLICLGDYVDRGPASAEVIDLLLDLPQGTDAPPRFLMGNHDQTFLDFLTDSRIGPDWGEFGGRETLAAYGVTPPAPRAGPEAWEAAREALSAAVPPAHRAFLNQLGLTFEIGGYFFAHAGARPGVDLQNQSERDLLWIREPFLSDPRRFGLVVVHGHTPAEAPFADHRRIGLDTGAYATGVLTAVRLEGADRRFVQSRRTSDDRVEVVERPA